MKSTKRVKYHVIFDGVENTILKNCGRFNGADNDISAHHDLDSSKIKVQLPPFIIAMFIALVSPMITLAQLPDLGTAVNFAIFTTAGALGNTGTSDITGNIGTNDGAITGFDPPTVVYGDIDSVNSVTAQCAIDVQAAYDEIFIITPTVVGHVPAFGSGETITAGVYFISAAGSVGGNLTLDAAGDPDAIFIFQFGGAFTTGAASTIILINAASANNVFWISEGAIAMAAGTNMKGSLISNNGAISMGAGGTLEGRMLTTAGAASLYNSLVTLPSSVSLPVSLLSFTGHCEQQNIVLQWRTATEINNNYFTIERSLNGINWLIAGQVTGAGNSSSPLNYTLKELGKNKGTTYYRLKQTDYNGNYKYAATIGINQCEDDETAHFTIYPNPSKGKFELRYDGKSSDINAIDIFNEQGQHVYNSTNFVSSIDLPNAVPGFHFMRVQVNSEMLILKFIIAN